MPTLFDYTKLDFAKTVGHNISRIRKQKHLKQVELSLSAGLDRSYISEVENGKKGISIYNLYKVKKALNTSFDKLLKCHTTDHTH